MTPSLRYGVLHDPISLNLPPSVYAPPPHLFQLGMLVTWTRTPPLALVQLRADKLAAMRAGKPTGVAKKNKAVKKVGKDFYKKMVVDSDYVGEDYDVFSNWLGSTEKA